VCFFLPACRDDAAANAQTPAQSVANFVPPKDTSDEIGVQYGPKELAGWKTATLDGKQVRVSPPLSVASGYELNQHRVTVVYQGRGTVQVSLLHNRGDSLQSALNSRTWHTPLRAVGNREETLFWSGRSGERQAWVALHVTGDAKPIAVRHICWRGKGTIYGHVPGTFEFAGGTLPYRLLFPKDYDPKKSYPLVISVHGSGGVGTDNAKSMEMVIVARHLGTRYFADPDFACFSLVPQIPPNDAVPAPYWPDGELGKPTRAHPDWPTVNEKGWYVQATLALIRAMLAEKSLNIDPTRVYYTGFSYGGKACWEFLRAAPDLWAAAMCGSGWPIGRAYSNPSPEQFEALKAEVARHKQVPVAIFAGGQDPMRFGSAAVHKALQAVGGTSSYTEFENTKHVQTAGKIWANPEYVGWMFKQRRPAATPPATRLGG
jgi:poly(3-hydroxybutyrate) depolymerase